MYCIYSFPYILFLSFPGKKCKTKALSRFSIQNNFSFLSFPFIYFFLLFLLISYQNSIFIRQFSTYYIGSNPTHRLINYVLFRKRRTSTFKILEFWKKQNERKKVDLYTFLCFQDICLLFSPVPV